MAMERVDANWHSSQPGRNTTENACLRRVRMDNRGFLEPKISDELPQRFQIAPWVRSHRVDFGTLTGWTCLDVLRNPPCSPHRRSRFQPINRPSSPYFAETRQLPEDDCDRSTAIARQATNDLCDFGRGICQCLYGHGSWTNRTIPFLACRSLVLKRASGSWGAGAVTIFVWSVFR